jgi:four helix bundle protein
MSSSAEVQSHMYVVLDQDYVSKKKFCEIYNQAEKTSRLISGLINYLRTNERRYQQVKREKRDKPEKS